MAVYTISALKSRINQYIKQNFNQEITGPVAQGIFQDVVDSLNAIIEAVTPTDIRHDIEELIEGENTISFTSALGTLGTSYTLTMNCYDSEGSVGYSISNRSKDGFKITVAADATLEYQAIKL